MTFHPDPVEVTRHPRRSSLAALFMSLLDDAKGLISQELRLARHEFQEELGRAKGAALWVSIGIGLLAVSSLLVILMLVHMLQAFSRLPLWACYGIVGVALAIMGGVLLARAKKTVREVDLVPGKTIETLKEQVTWIKDQTKSVRT